MTTTIKVRGHARGPAFLFRIGNAREFRTLQAMWFRRCVSNKPSCARRRTVDDKGLLPHDERCHVEHGMSGVDPNIISKDCGSLVLPTEGAGLLPWNKPYR